MAEFHDYGALAAALAKAQAAFPAISRDKEVTVQTKAGGSYKFKYAPLDSILSAVRKPLADNGLAIIQLLDDDVLVTSLLHDSGAILSGRTPIPQTEGVQAYGSAITYLRRYSIQALLAIAAEEDDDGNTASGNSATFSGRRDDGPRTSPASTEPVLVGPWHGAGKLVVRKSGSADGALRQGPEGGYFMVAFDATDEKNIPQVLVRDPLAVDLLEAAGSNLNGLVCEIGGDLFTVPYEKDGYSRPFQRLHLAWIRTAGWSLPVPTQTGPGLFDAETESELDAALV